MILFSLTEMWQLSFHIPEIVTFYLDLRNPSIPSALVDMEEEEEGGVKVSEEGTWKNK